MLYARIKINIVFLWLSAFLHDIGKVKIDKQILNTNRQLTAQEMHLIKSHAIEGAKLCSISKRLSKIIKCHHENDDGTGYLGLQASQIPFEAKIIRIIDVYDALSNKRPYKDACTLDETMEIMNSTKSHFDASLFETFLSFMNYSVDGKISEMIVS